MAYTCGFPTLVQSLIQGVGTQRKLLLRARTFLLVQVCQCQYPPEPMFESSIHPCVNSRFKAAMGNIREYLGISEKYSRAHIFESKMHPCVSSRFKSNPVLTVVLKAGVGNI